MKKIDIIKELTNQRNLNTINKNSNYKSSRDNEELDNQNFQEISSLFNFFKLNRVNRTEKNTSILSIFLSESDYTRTINQVFNIKKRVDLK